MINELKYVFRGFRRKPLTASVIIATLAVGIAANATVYTLVAPFLFRPLDYQDPQQLVHLYHQDPKEGSTARFSIPQFLDWQSMSQVYQEMGIYNYRPLNVSLKTDSPPEQVMTGRVTPNLFSLLGVTPLVGSELRPEHDQPGPGYVALLSHKLWQLRFNSDPGVVGQEIFVDGASYRVLGVMPEEFKFPFGEIEMWIPILRQPKYETREGTNYLMVGRLAPNRTLEDAIKEGRQIHDELAATFPEQDGYFTGVRVVKLKEGLIFHYGIVSLLMYLVLGLVGLVLLIVVANVANILLAKSVARNQEVAVRRAMGCSRGDLARLFLTESLTLALLGALGGVLLAQQAVDVLSAAIPESLFRVGTYQIDGMALGFTAGVSLLAALLFGTIPVAGTLKVRLVDALKEGGSKTSGGLGGQRLRTVLASLQIFVAVVLVLAAVFLLSSLRNMRTQDYGFDPETTLSLRVSLPSDTYTTRSQILEYHDQVKSRLMALSSVENVSSVHPLPLNHSFSTIDLRVEGYEPRSANERVFANRMIVGSDFFATAGIQVLAGRPINAGDTPDTEAVAVVNKTFAERYFNDNEAVDRQIHLLYRSGDSKPVRIVGVVDDIRHRVEWQEGDAIWPQLYLPISQGATRMTSLVVRTDTPEATLAGILPILRQIDANVPVDQPRTLGEVAAESYQPVLMMSRTLSVLALVAIFLAAIGIYGVLTFTMAQRLKEIGIRMAIGASPSMIRQHVLRQGFLFALYGTVPGLVVVIGAMIFLRGPLAGFGSLSPFALVLTALIVTLLALFSSLAPARRAGRLQPLNLLVEE